MTLNDGFGWLNIEAGGSSGRSNIFEVMEHDYMSRGYLLPDGCKELYDALMLKHQPGHYPIAKLQTEIAQLPKEREPLPPVKGEIIIPAQTTTVQLAALLGQKPALIVADLMQMGVFSGASQPLNFETIRRVARKHGFIAKKAA
jgi:hypothetical protein